MLYFRVCENHILIITGVHRITDPMCKPWSVLKLFSRGAFECFTVNSKRRTWIERINDLYCSQEVNIFQCWQSYIPTVTTHSFHHSPSSPASQLIRSLTDTLIKVARCCPYVCLLLIPPCGMACGTVRLKPLSVPCMEERDKKLPWRPQPEKSDLSALPFGQETVRHPNVTNVTKLSVSTDVTITDVSFYFLKALIEGLLPNLAHACCIFWCIWRLLLCTRMPGDNTVVGEKVTCFSESLLFVLWNYYVAFWLVKFR